MTEALQKGQKRYSLCKKDLLPSIYGREFTQFEHFLARVDTFMAGRILNIFAKQMS